MRLPDPDPETLARLIQQAGEEAYLACRDFITKCVLCGAPAEHVAAGVPVDPWLYSPAALAARPAPVHVFGLCGACVLLPDWGERAAEKRRQRWGDEP